MKTLHLVILVKYAQGAVVFNSFYSMLKSLKPPERKIFLLQIVELIEHFATDDSMAELAIKESGLNNNCSVCLILKTGVNETQLKKIVEESESELEPSFRLLLTLFSIGYQDGYNKHKNASNEFWYWDYSEIENVEKLLRIDENKKVQLDKILRP